jgi:hypothetical protein
VSDWKTKFLSQAGKEILLKAVVQAIPTYSMSIFLFPKELCKEINSIVQRFWWGHKENENKIHWMSWEKLGRPKTQRGMGFRDLTSFNKALLAKQGWRLIQYPDSLVSKIFKAKYYPNNNFLEAKIGNRPSLAWMSIFSTISLLEEGLMWRTGDSNSVNIWGDRWIPRASSYKIQSQVHGLTSEAKVSALIDHDTASWNKQLIRDLFSKEEMEAICSLPLSRYKQ